jgi:hypothetical protein
LFRQIVSSRAGLELFQLTQLRLASLVLDARVLFGCALIIAQECWIRSVALACTPHLLGDIQVLGPSFCNAQRLGLQEALDFEITQAHEKPIAAQLERAPPAFCSGRFNATDEVGSANLIAGGLRR